MPFRWRTTVLLSLAACAHDLPPEPGEWVVDTIPDLGPPERLTLSPWKDATPMFAPDGRGVWYAWERRDQPDHDLCIGLLPVAGGTRIHEVCNNAPGSTPDSINWYTFPTPHPDGRRIAWLRIAGRSDALEGGRGDVVLADISALDQPHGFSLLSIFPFQVAPGSTQHLHVQPVGMEWANDSVLVYVGTLVTAFQANGLAQDTFYSGRELGTLTLSGDSAVSGFIAGTEEASGVTVAPGGILYFTRKGDGRVFRTTLAGGTVDTVFDFGTGAEGPFDFARDPVYVGGAIYAVVGGDVSNEFYANIPEPLQHDGGGELWRVDSTGPALVSNLFRWRHPALSPDGRTLVIEGRDPDGVTDLYFLRIE